MIYLSICFDTLNRSILLKKKLTFYGIGGVRLEWFDSYFSMRDQVVSLEGTNSISRLNKIGVVQGCALGAVLFILHVNDLVKCSNFFFFFLNADDTSALVTDKNLNGLILNVNLESKKVFDWFQTNQLSMNFSKCKFMMVRRRLQLP